MNLQLATVIVVVSASIYYIVHRLYSNWRRSQTGGCASCPVARLRGE